MIIYWDRFNYFNKGFDDLESFDFNVDSMLDIGHKSNGLFSIENVTLIRGGRKSLHRVFNNSINSKMDLARYRNIKEKVPTQLLMCCKTVAFLDLIGNFIDFFSKITLVEYNCVFDDFSELLDDGFIKKFSDKNSNGFFKERNVSVFFSIDYNFKTSYSICFTDLSFRLISSYNDVGDHLFIFDVIGNPNKKYIIDNVKDLSIVKKYILEKSPIYKIMTDYGYKISDDVNNEDLTKIVQIATMASH